MPHKTKYRFYIRKDRLSDPVDIESGYACDYLSFEGLVPAGDIQNVYEETFSEQSGARVYTPSWNDLAYKPYECKLRLLFRGSMALFLANQFHADNRGIKLEYSDTFRKVFATLLMTKKMEIEQERLYGDEPYIVAAYTFTNVKGRTFSQSQFMKVNQEDTE